MAASEGDSCSSRGVSTSTNSARASSSRSAVTEPCPRCLPRLIERLEGLVQESSALERRQALLVLVLLGQPQHVPREELERALAVQVDRAHRPGTRHFARLQRRRPRETAVPRHRDARRAARATRAPARRARQPAPGATSAPRVRTPVSAAAQASWPPTRRGRLVDERRPIHERIVFERERRERRRGVAATGGDRESSRAMPPTRRLRPASRARSAPCASRRRYDGGVRATRRRRARRDAGSRNRRTAPQRHPRAARRRVRGPA